MKKILSCLLILAILSGCAGCGQVPLDDPSLSAPEEDPLEETEIESPFRIVGEYDGFFMLAPLREGEETGDLIILNPDSLELADRFGEAMEKEDLSPGQVVRIRFDGTMLLTWPATLSHPTHLTVTGETECLVPFYLELADELWEKDDGLNHDITKIAMDLDEAANLSDLEKQALCYIVGWKYQKEAFLSDYASLVGQGQIDEENLRWDDGVILSFSTDRISEDAFTLSAMKWRSGLGAIGYSGAEAKKKDDRWEIAYEGWFIS